LWRSAAPSGETPVLIPPFRYWERLSVAAALVVVWLAAVSGVLLKAGAP
jgi:hypothetical protein